MSTTTDNLPETVPVLTARHMYKGSLSDLRGHHCLLGWVGKCAAGSPYRFDDPGTMRVRDAIAKAAKIRMNEIDVFNDADDTTKTMTADVWNRAFRDVLHYRRPGRYWRARACDEWQRVSLLTWWRTRWTACEGEGWMRVEG